MTEIEAKNWREGKAWRWRQDVEETEPWGWSSTPHQGAAERSAHSAVPKSDSWRLGGLDDKRTWWASRRKGSSSSSPMATMIVAATHGRIGGWEGFRSWLNHAWKANKARRTPYLVIKETLCSCHYFHTKLLEICEKSGKNRAGTPESPTRAFQNRQVEQKG